MTSLVIGPLNAAGQAAAWARAVRQAGHDATSVSYRPRPSLRPAARPDLDAPSDLTLPYPRLTTAVGRARRARRLVAGATHLAIDGFAPILGPVLDGLLPPELERFTSWGKQIALIAHGSDVRDPYRHARENAGSYFPLLDPVLRDRLAARSAANRSLVEGAGLPVYVSTPDLLLDLPGATWLPLCTDPVAWSVTSRTWNARPRVLHLPTSQFKGSDVIDPVLRDLERAGRLTYVRPARVPHGQMRDLMATVDVVVDQVRSGAYGMTAVESMMSGALTMAHISDEVRGLLPEEPRLVDAPPDMFRSAVEGLLDRQAEWPDMARRSREYALRWHGGSMSAEALGTFLSDS